MKSMQKEMEQRPASGEVRGVFGPDFVHGKGSSLFKEAMELDLDEVVKNAQGKDIDLLDPISWVKGIKIYEKKIPNITFKVGTGKRPQRTLWFNTRDIVEEDVSPEERINKKNTGKLLGTLALAEAKLRLIDEKVPSTYALMHTRAKRGIKKIQKAEKKILDIPNFKEKTIAGLSEHILGLKSGDIQNYIPKGKGAAASGALTLGMIISACGPINTGNIKDRIFPTEPITTEVVPGMKETTPVPTASFGFSFLKKPEQNRESFNGIVVDSEGDSWHMIEEDYELVGDSPGTFGGWIKEESIPEDEREEGVRWGKWSNSEGWGRVRFEETYSSQSLEAEPTLEPAPTEDASLLKLKEEISQEWKEDWHVDMNSGVKAIIDKEGITHWIELDENIGWVPMPKPEEGTEPYKLWKEDGIWYAGYILENGEKEIKIKYFKEMDLWVELFLPNYEEIENSVTDFLNSPNKYRDTSGPEFFTDGHGNKLGLDYFHIFSDTDTKSSITYTTLSATPVLLASYSDGENGYFVLGSFDANNHPFAWVVNIGFLDEVKYPDLSKIGYASARQEDLPINPYTRWGISHTKYILKSSQKLIGVPIGVIFFKANAYSKTSSLNEEEKKYYEEHTVTNYYFDSVVSAYKGIYKDVDFIFRRDGDVKDIDKLNDVPAVYQFLFNFISVSKKES